MKLVKPHTHTEKKGDSYMPMITEQHNMIFIIIK